MEPLTWTGSLGFLNPVFLTAFSVMVIAFVVQFLMALVGFRGGGLQPAGDGTAVRLRSPLDWVNQVLSWALWAVLALVLIYLVGGIVLHGAAKGIFGWLATRFWPVWLSLIVMFAVSIRYRRRLGLYGKLMDSPIGSIGFALVMFWVFTAFYAEIIATHDPLAQLSGMKNKPPGTPVSGTDFWYLLGGDNLARDVFSRMVFGARSVLQIAPAATLFAFMVGITLGLPAGYQGGWLDTLLSFLANLVLAFPVILLFYLLVTPEILETGPTLGDIFGGGLTWRLSVPNVMAAVLFLFPVIFLCVLINSRLYTQPPRRNLWIGITLVVGLWIYAGLAFNADPLGIVSIPSNILIVFVSVVFVNAPTVFRIVRGLTLDIKTRDYVAAAQTRGEGLWYIMLWEILPNARGPLIVDFCLRIGYTTILLGTLGFFGLGVTPESPDWGSTINTGRQLLTLYPHTAMVPALSLMSLVLGLNLLADGLREESLRD